MRGWWLAVTLVAATSASAQSLFLGAGAGTLWERRSPLAPEKDWRHSDRPALFAFAAVPIDEDTHVRLERMELPRDVVAGGEVWRGRLAGWAVGVDYFLPGVWGRALVAAGLGSYRLDLTARRPPAGVEDTRFGWYLKVGEWFALSKRFTLAAEVAYHRTNHRGSVQLLQASGALVARF